MMDGQGKSDRLIVPKKATNKAGELAAEALEGRGLAKGNPNQRDTDRTQGRERVSSALERVRQAGNRSASDSRQEPGAVVPHAGIRGGGAPQGASLLRPPRGLFARRSAGGDKPDPYRTKGHDRAN